MSAREPKKARLSNSIVQQQMIAGNLHQAINHQLQGTSINRQSEFDAMPIFYREISDIMRGFGDCAKPLHDSIVLMEKILRTQLKGILHDVIEVAMRRKGEPIPLQRDFEFLMRNHPVRITRLRKHIRDMELLRRVLSYHSLKESSELNEASSELNEATAAIANQHSDGGGDDVDINVMELYDEEKVRRFFRADRISSLYNVTQWKEFTEARRTSFYCRHSEKMKYKLTSFLGITPDLQLPMDCYNILSYLAHETIASVVDMAILTRLNSDNRIVDPFSRITESEKTHRMLHLCPEVTQGRGLDGIKPITVQEIQEGVRRFNQATNIGFGFHRNAIKTRNCYFAI